VNESGSDIFASQPFSVVSNIHNKYDPDEQVLGFFSVSGVKQMRKDITIHDVVELNLPYYNYECEKFELAPWDWPWSVFNPPLTWDDIYEMFTSSGYYFVEPRYYSGTWELEKLIFAWPECADCEFTGSRDEPHFPLE
jgi:hypothetical protein